ncbi:MAG: CPBP family glutamic-type intramembrane protease [Bacteroidota bacterium]
MRDHIREEANWGYYVSMLLFLGLITWSNYFLLPNQTIEDWIVQRAFGQPEAFWWYLLFYGLPYLISIGIYATFHHQWQVFRQKDFWIRFGLIMVLLSLDAAYYYYRHIFADVSSVYERYVLTKIVATFTSAMFLGLPLYIFWRAWDRQQESFYGLTWKKFDWRPYFLMLLIMVPIVLAASYTEDFINYYPTLRWRYVLRQEALPTWLAYLIYEFSYGLDFTWTELTFRGFMILGMARILGKGAVLPMVSVYVSRHFAKPMGESISSIFGGYILGVIALRSRNIMGGVLIHMGVALLMEIFALLQKL